MFEMSEKAKEARRAYQRQRYAQRTQAQIEKAKERRAAYWERKAEEAARGKS